MKELEETWKSWAQWPIGTIGFDDEITTDTHDARDSAEAVCNRLMVEGFGGMGKIFPLRTRAYKVGR